MRDEDGELRAGALSGVGGGDRRGRDGGRAQGNKVFVEDDDGSGADNQANIPELGRRRAWCTSTAGAPGGPAGAEGHPYPPLGSC